MRSSAVWLLLLAGCNLALGLDATVRDSDRDQVADDIDNCPSVANPMQTDHNGDDVGDLCVCIETGEDVDQDAIDDGCDECIGTGPIGVDSGGDGIDDGCAVCAAGIGIDRDADGLDDGCDTCLLGPPHDEDGDTIADRCDVCPTISDVDQTIDLDADFVGDTCDPGERPDVLVLFESFSEPRAGLPPEWTIAGDALHVAITGRATQTLRFDPRSDEFVAETRVPETVGMGEIGLSIVDASCALIANRVLRLVVPGIPPVSSKQIPGTGPIRMRLQQANLNGQLFPLSCQAIGDDGAALESIVLELDVPIVGNIGLFASNASGSFEYFWLLESAF